MLESHNWRDFSLVYTGGDMKLSLTPSFELSNEHAASSCGAPVLVNRHTDEAYAPTDILAAYSMWGPVCAASAVLRMVHGKELTGDEREFVKRFTG